MDNINPDKINKTKNALVKNFITDMIERKELTFECMLKYFKACLDQKDHEEAMIWIYYINNVIKKRPDMDTMYQNELIVAMLDDLRRVCSDTDKYLKE